MANEPQIYQRSPSPPRPHYRPVPVAPKEHEWPELQIPEGTRFLEEESLEWYSPDKWLSVQIGEISHSPYQVLLKLGFGSVSTAWLCRDLRQNNNTKYVTLKICETGHRQALNERKVLHTLEVQASRRLSTRERSWCGWRGIPLRWMG